MVKKCGINGYVCDPMDYLRCDPNMGGFEGLSRLYVSRFDKEGDQPLHYEAVDSDKNRLGRELQSLQKDPTKEEVASGLRSGWFKKNGFMGVCVSESLGRFYAFTDYLTKMERLIYKSAASERPTIGQAVIKMDAEQAECVVRDLDLNPGDIACSDGKCPPRSDIDKKVIEMATPEMKKVLKDSGLVVEGSYQFTTDAMRLQQMIGGIETLSCLDDDKKAELKKFLKDIYGNTPNGSRGGIFKSILAYGGAMGGLAFGVYILLVLGRDFIKPLLVNRVKLTDLRKKFREILKTDPNYLIKGAVEDAKKFWRRMDSIRFRSLIVSGISGSGKDVRIDQMMVLKEQGDPSVPDFAKDAPAYEISGVEFNSNTKYRGTVADKLKEIVELVKTKVVVLRVREIDLILMAGSTEGGDAERVAKLLLSMLETHNKNLILLGSTSRLEELLKGDPDLERRLNVVKVAEALLANVVDTIEGGTWQTEFERYHKVRITKDVLFAAGAFAEKVYRPSTLRLDARGKYQQYPRYDAVLTVLEETLRIAKGEGRSEATVKDVVRATESLTGQTLEEGYVDNLVKRAVTDIASLEGEVSFAAERVIQRIKAVDGLRKFFVRPDMEKVLNKFAENMVRIWEETPDPTKDRARLLDLANGHETGDTDVAICVIEEEGKWLRTQMERSGATGEQMTVSEAFTLMDRAILSDPRFADLASLDPRVRLVYLKKAFLHWEESSPLVKVRISEAQTAEGGKFIGGVPVEVIGRFIDVEHEKATRGHMEEVSKGRAGREEDPRLRKDREGREEAAGEDLLERIIREGRERGGKGGPRGGGMAH